MGTAASALPAEGSNINPRVAYVAEQAKSQQKNLVIDVPPLVEYAHGSVRYRYIQHKNEEVRTEAPYQGSEGLGFKKGYFYHAKLKDYSTEAKLAEVRDHHQQYVVKNPRSSYNRHIYFITQKGFDTPALHGIQTVNRDGNRTPTWPNIEILPHRAYYSIAISATDNRSLDSENNETERVDMKAAVRLVMNGSEKVKDVKDTISMKILRPAAYIHLFHDSREIPNTVDLRSLGDALPNESKILVTAQSLLT